MSTTKQYDQHLRLHIVPLIGTKRLNEITVPFVRQFLDTLAKEGRSRAMVRAVRVSFGALISDAQERGLVMANAVKEIGRGKARARSAARHSEPAVVGVDIPTPEEIRAMLAYTEGKTRVFFMTAIFTGMRASELRGLRWSDVDFGRMEINVNQRADAWNQIGSPKSKSGRRSIPIVKALADALTEWRKDCPEGERDLVFPTGIGTTEYHNNVVTRWFHPPQVAAGICVPTDKLKKGKPVMAAKYTGLHSLRHFYASWCINPPSAGGLGLSPKIVQERMGHSSIQVTLDTYSHLFERAGAGDTMNDAANALLK